MNQQEIEQIVTELIVDKLGISVAEISFTSTLKDFGADSLDEVEIVMELERKFDIAIPDSIMPEIQSIGSLCRYIENNL